MLRIGARAETVSFHLALTSPNESCPYQRHRSSATAMARRTECFFQALISSAHETKVQNHVGNRRSIAFSSNTGDTRGVSPVESGGFVDPCHHDSRDLCGPLYVTH